MNEPLAYVQEIHNLLAQMDLYSADLPFYRKSPLEEQIREVLRKKIELAEAERILVDHPSLMEDYANLCRRYFARELLLIDQGKTVFQKDYSDESLIDLDENLHDNLNNSEINPLVKDIPHDEHGFRSGTFTVTVTWKPD